MSGFVQVSKMSKAEFDDDNDNVLRITKHPEQTMMKQTPLGKKLRTEKENMIHPSPTNQPSTTPVKRGKKMDNEEAKTKVR